MKKNSSGPIKALLIGLTVLVLMSLAACAGSPAQQQETGSQGSAGAGETQEPAAQEPAAQEPAAQTPAETEAPAAEQGSEDPQRLMIPRWFLASLTLDGQPVEVQPGQQAVTLQFEPGGKANGTGGCNDFSTTYEADYDGTMKFGPIISTKMMCDATINLENAYLQALSKVERFSTEDGLVLSSADGKTQIVLQMPPK